MKKEENKLTGLEVAVIGMAGRFPGADNVDEFWNNLKNGVESIVFFSEEELEQTGIDPQLINNPNYVKANGILEDKSCFDSSFFGYSPREAEVMDPQLRLFHECCWQTFEDAGYDPSSYSETIGVYAGAATSFTWQVMSFLSGKGSQIGGFARDMLSSSQSLSTRISHKLNLRGPSFTLFTACSTSLVAIHLACRALLTGECSMALAGGVTVTAKQTGGYLYEEGLIHSPDGHCRVFDARANGTVFGEGVGCVVMKRAKEAIKDRNHIYALVKGTAVNNDGMTKVDYTAPSVKGEVSVIRRALNLARVVPTSIGYVETHGTGTKLGDPIEITALTKAFKTDTDTEKSGRCAIGSVKANIGHLDITAGVAAFIKTVLVLKHRFIPPVLNFENPNPAVDFENSPFYVNTEPMEWNNEDASSPRRAAVSSFGIGGTNAHVILEEAPIAKSAKRQAHDAWSQGKGGVSPPYQSRDYQLIVLSAKTETALEQMTSNLAEYFKKNPNVNFADAAYTLQVGRKTFQHRRMLVSRDVEEAISSLSSPDLGNLRSALAKNENTKVVFMFPGQGAQYVNMGRELYRSEPVFREAMDRCFEILKPLLNFDIKEIIYPSDMSDRPDQSHQINQTEMAQPLLFVFEYALAQLLMKWGIKPGAMIGHSIGEYVAAHLAGVFSLEDALTLVALRGRLMQQMPPGSMLNVNISGDQLSPLVNDHKEISIAALNAPSLCVVSGPDEAVKAFSQQLLQKGYETKTLHTSHAFHSKMMAPILKEFEEKVKQIAMNKPEIPYISNVTGKQVTMADLGVPGYWSDHLRQTVRFSDGVKELLKEEYPVFIEVGPGKALSSLVNLHKDKNQGPITVSLVRHPKENEPDHCFLLNKIGQLWLQGQSIDWTGFYSQEKRYRISLPTYPFKGQEYWIESEAIQAGTGKGAKDTLSRKVDMAEWFYIPLWEQSLFPGDNLQKPAEQLNWLIFLDENGVGTRLARGLKQYNQTVTVTGVKMGSGFNKKKESDGEYVIAPCCSGDYDTLFKELTKQDKIPQKIVHCWGVTGNNDNDGELDSESIDDFQDRGFYSLLNIVQALGRQGVADEIELTVLTDNMHEIVGQVALCPLKATIMGAVKVIPLEYANINCRTIDIVIPPRKSPGEHQLTERLLSELTSGVSDIVIALRGNHRWVQRLKPIRFDKPRGIGKHLKEEGVYLITGGLGGIGFSLAQFLAKTVKAKLVLTGRSTLPPRDEWDKWLSSHDEKDDIALKIRRVRDLEEQGADLLIVKADAANKKQMQDVITRARERFGKLNGVLHAAGVIDYGGVIQKRTQEVTENCMAAKIKGTLVLNEIFRNDTLDFVVLFSTVGNVLYKDKFGQVGYAAANEFLEAFASYKAVNDRSGTCTIAVNWPDWLEVGMVMEALNKRHKGNQEKIEADIRTFADFAISPTEGIEIFSRIMNQSYSRVFVSPRDLAIMIEYMNRQLKSLKEEEFPLPGTSEETAPSQTLYQRPELTTPYAAPENEIEQKLAVIFQGFLGIENIGIYDDFFELGGNSLVAMGLIDIIHKQLAIKIPLTVLFSRPTISKLSVYIAETENTYYSIIKPQEEKDYYPLSSAQRRLFIVQQLNLENTVYNVVRTLPLRGDVSIKKLEEVFNNLINRQQGLRTSLEMVKGEPVQRIRKEIEFKIPLHSVNTKEEVVAVAAPYIRPFDLSLAPLLRVGLIKIGTTPPLHILVMVTHHIVCDGYAELLMTREYKALFNREKLPPLKLQYKDFSQWQNSLEYRKMIKSQENYWLNEFSGEIPMVILPTDYERPSVQSFEGYILYFPLGKELSDRLYRFAREKEFTLFMVLLTGYYILLFKYTLQQDIIVGSPITGRKYIDLQNIIGMFVNMLCLRGHPHGEKTIKSFLAETKEKILAALENQDYQFEELTQRLGMQGELGSNPLFNTVFEMQQVDIGINRDNHLDEKPHNPQPAQAGEIAYDIHAPIQSPFDLIVSTLERDGDLVIKFTYSIKLFKRTTVENLAKHFTEILNHLVKNETLQLKDITLSHKLLKVESTGYNSQKDDFVF